MKFSTFYDSLPFGGRRSLANTLGVDSSFLYQIAHGIRPPPPAVCWAIQRESKGLVTVHDLLPEVFGPATGVSPTNKRTKR